jgi:hypothetical protein
MILVVDDLRMFPFEAVYARTSAEAIDIMVKADPEWIGQLWLDHDLGGEDTTMRVVDYLMERAFYDWPLDIEQVYVHSDNPPGCETITRALSRHYKVTRVDAKMIGAWVP